MKDLTATDTSLQAAKFALDGLSMRQQTISRNLANIDTPGFKAQQVRFEDVLRRLTGKGDRIGLAATHNAHLASPAAQATPVISMRPGGSLRGDENSVDIEVELTEMTQTGIQYQALTQLVSKKLQLLKTIASSR